MDFSGCAAKPHAACKGRCGHSGEICETTHDRTHGGTPSGARQEGDLAEGENVNGVTAKSSNLLVEEEE